MNYGEYRVNKEMLFMLSEALFVDTMLFESYVNGLLRTSFFEENTEPHISTKYMWYDIYFCAIKSRHYTPDMSDYMAFNLRTRLNAHDPGNKILFFEYGDDYIIKKHPDLKVNIEFDKSLV